MRRSKRRVGSGRPAAVLTGLLLAAVLAACGGTTTGHNTSSTASTAPAGTASSPAPASATRSRPGLQQQFVSVIAKVRPQVVEISTTSGLGSGIIYDTKGDIVTNDHVVGSATSFRVTLVDGQSLPATLVGAYPPDDLAVVRVKGATKLSPATFGDSKQLQIGDIVLAIGNPLGLASSVTEGIVSYNGRTVPENSTGVVLPSTIQTSAAINPGNSGGALVDLNAHVVGIPTLAATDQQLGGGAAPGIGFAIPSNTIKLIIPQLIQSGHVTRSGRAALGITAGDAINELGAPVGALVHSVSPGGAAARAGILAGDVIIALDGQQVSSVADLEDALAGLRPGSSAQVRFRSQSGAVRTVTLVLGQLPG